MLNISGVAKAGGAAVLLFAIVLAGCAPGQASERTVVEVRMMDDGGHLRFEPANIEAKRGDMIRFVQSGTMPHNVEFVRNGAPEGVELSELWSSDYLQADGDVYEVEIDDRFLDGEYAFVCAPHVTLDMIGTLRVSGGEGGSESASFSSSDNASAAGMESDRPVVTGVQGLQPLAHEMDGDVKVFRLLAEEIRWETKEGTLVEALAYNRMVPGPLIRVTEGDRVRIVVTNGLAQPHTTHWHGLFLPNSMDGVPGISQDPILPGESFSYEFEAQPHGTRLYHSHFNAARQEGSGLYGMLVIDEKNPPAVRQSDREELMLLADGMGYVVNGKEFPMTEPIRMRMGERVRVRMANLGAMYHPMHLHGGFFTVIAKDGFPLETPQKMNTISIAPGETYDVVLAPQFGGTWIWHCHVLSHVTGPRDADGNDTSAGMVGVVIVDDGLTALADPAAHTNH